MKKKAAALLVSLSTATLLAGCMEEGKMSPEEEDVDVVDPGTGKEEESNNESGSD